MAELLAAAPIILAMIRKAGLGDAVQWLRKLDFAQYQGVVLKAFGTMLDRIGGSRLARSDARITSLKAASPTNICWKVPMTSRLVRWRLLWEDKRYQDGTIPVEEETYLPKPAAQPRLRAMPGEPCTRTGYWQNPAMKDPVYVKTGDPMPGPQHTSWGMVIWQYCDPQPDN